VIPLPVGAVPVKVEILDALGGVLETQPIEGAR
jgi:hypothetical protein